MIPHLHLSRTLRKLSWAPPVTVKSIQKTFDRTASLQLALSIFITFNHIFPKKSYLQSRNAHFTSHHLKMVSCCVQLSTAIIITAKGFLSSLLRFCSHSCSMSLQNNLKWKRKKILKTPTKPHTKITITKMNQSLFCCQARAWYLELYFAVKPELILIGFFCLSLLCHVFLSPQ